MAMVMVMVMVMVVVVVVVAAAARSIDGAVQRANFDLGQLTVR